ncbi:MAG: HD domain-containing protein [Pseudomonadota bacterium]
MSRIASIDVGSNAFRIAVAEVNRAGAIRVLARRRESIRLGKDVFSTGSISTKTLRESVEVFRGFREMCDRYGVSLVKAAGTSALREARNGARFVNSIRSRTGISIDIISGSEEARLIQLAVAHAVSLRGRLAVLVDMGGGSTEVSLVRNGDIVLSETHPIGAVRLLHLLEAKRYSPKRFSNLVRGYVSGLQRQLKRHIDQERVTLCVGTGGNFESLAELAARLFKRSDSKRLLLSDLERIIRLLSGMSTQERIETLELRPDRADVISPPAEVLAEIMRSVGVRHVRIPGVGLKDGLIIDLLPKISRGRSELERKQHLAFAREMCRAYQNDERHAERVRERAAQLFDRTVKLHKLPPEAKLWLEIAAVLHDIGHFVSSEDHHKHSQYLIRATPFIGLDQRAQDIVSCLARYHRKSLPKMEHYVYRDLSPADKLVVRKLAAILRIADASDRGHGKVRDLAFTVKKGRCILKLKGAGEMLLEQWAISKKADLFELQFKKKIEVVAESSRRRSRRV